MENRTVKILAIDDIQDNLISLKALLFDSFPTAVVITTLDGQKGIEIAAIENPDVILLDIIMPVMDGFEVCRILKENEKTKDIPIVFITAIKGDKESRIQALESGGDAFLAKPIDESELVAQIRAMVKIKEAKEHLKREKVNLEKLVHERTKKLEEELAEHQQTMGALLKTKKLLLQTSEMARVGGWENIFSNREDNWTAIMREIHEVDSDFIPNMQNAINFYKEGESRNKITHLVTKVMEEGGSFDTELQIVTAKGNERWVRVIGNTEQRDGKCYRLFGTFQDINNKKIAEQKIKEASKNWNITFDAISDAIALLDKNQQIIQSNQAFKNIIEVDVDLLADRSCFRYVHQTDCPIKGCPFIRMKKSKKREKMEMVVTNKIWEVIVDPILDEENNIQGAVHIISDITDRKTIEKELIIAKNKAEESDRLKSAFLANMSHEIRTPMNGILGFVELLQDDKISKEQQLLYSNIIRSSSQRLMNTISDIIEVSRIEAQQSPVNYSKVDINEVMNYIYSFYSVEIKQKGLTFLMNNVFENEKHLIITDYNKLGSILSNLLKNALKFTNSGFIELGNSLHENVLSFYVKDSGIGIPKDKLGVIFERFVQADMAITRPYEGAGLGLSISKAYVEMLGGIISVESEPDKGTTIWFTIDYNAVHTNINNNKFDDSIVVNDKENDKMILIAEDDDSSFTYLNVLLSKLNYPIQRVKNGKEAVQFCQNNQNPVLILMDLKMPVMDGYEATRQIRKLNNKIPIIAQTAYALIGDREKALDAGCTDYISKPLRGDELLHIISQLIESSN